MANDVFNLANYRERQSLEEPEDEMRYFHVDLGESKDNEGEPVKDSIRIPPLRKWSIKAQDALASGRIVEAIQILVGPEDSRLFEQYDWTFGEFEALLDALSKWSGFQTGQPSVTPPVRGLTLKSN